MLADALPHLSLDVIGMLKHVIEGTPLDQQLGSGLFAHAGHTGNVVTRIALEAQEIGNEARRDTVALHDLFGRVDNDIGHALASRHDARGVTRELVGILITRDEKDTVAICLAARGHSAQDVIALIPVHRDAGDVHRLEQALNHGELHGEALVHGGTLRLVPRKQLHTPIGTMHIPSADDGVRMVVLDHLQEHLHESENGIGRCAIGRVHGSLHGMERAMEQGVSVNDSNESLRHGQPFGRYGQIVLP